MSFSWRRILNVFWCFWTPFSWGRRILGDPGVPIGGKGSHWGFSTASTLLSRLRRDNVNPITSTVILTQNNHCKPWSENRTRRRIRRREQHRSIGRVQFGHILTFVDAVPKPMKSIWWSLLSQSLFSDLLGTPLTPDARNPAKKSIEAMRSWICESGTLENQSGPLYSFPVRFLVQGSSQANIHCLLPCSRRTRILAFFRLRIAPTPYLSVCSETKKWSETKKVT